MKPKLSIITICFNNQNEIERTCESIIHQTWQDFEWIVVDGASTDGTVDILKKYEKYMTVFISEKDNGVYNAMNKGIKLAQGEWLNFMNGGDAFFSHDALEKVFNGKSYDADILYGNTCLCAENQSRQILRYSDIVTKSSLFTNIINHQASFIRAELFKKYGLYNENYRIVADLDKWIVFQMNGCRYQHIDEILSLFYTGGIGSRMTEEHKKERQDILRKYYTRINRYYLFGIPLLEVEDK